MSDRAARATRNTVLEAVTEAAKSLGYSSVKFQQQKALCAFLGGNDVFVSLPTGYGKSLCYGCLPRAFEILCNKSNCIAIIVSPLVAIMQDQVSAFTDKGLTAACVSGGMDPETKMTIMAGDVQLVFMSPEQVLRRGVWRNMLRSAVYQERLIAFVVDEAHCVKKW